MYYDDFHNTSPSPTPSQTTDAFGWESDQTPVPTESRDVTLAPPTAHPSSPASVTEISRDEFPPLAAPAPATITKPRAKATKVNKGKGKAKAATTTATAPTSDTDDPFLAADIAAATAASLGLLSPLDHATEGASLLHRPAAGTGSPSKRCCSNTASNTSPAPVPTTVAMPTVPTNTAQEPMPTVAPVASVVATPVAAPAISATATAPTTAAATSSPGRHNAM